MPADGGQRRIGANNSTVVGKGVYRHTCGKCGAVRQDSQLGLERTPEEYVANLVAIFRELRRILKPTGTAWLNLGDSYASGGGSGEQRLDELGERLGTGGGKKHSSRPSGRAPSAGLAQKQLVGIPWRVAFALQADGWYLRSDIIWSKPNPMPESVTDRPTKAHEYLFLLTKSARYFFDSDAVREAPAESTLRIHGSAGVVDRAGEWKTNEIGNGHSGLRNGSDRPGLNGRNLRSVWTIATRPYPGAHFAVFPPELPERCIKAGSSERGVCPECGAPWERVTTIERPAPRRPVGKHTEWTGIYGPSKTGYLGTHNGKPSVTTTGWQPTCAHDAEPVPAVVLDPFAGSGTTGMVANRLSRRAILIDLNASYLVQQMKRNAQVPLGLGA